MRLIFATWANAEYQGRVLTELGADRRLVSYWETSENEQVLFDYCANGKAGKPRVKK